MKKTPVVFACILPVILLSINISARAQNRLLHIIDSMKIALNKTNNDSTKVVILLNLTERYWSVNPPEGLKYVHQALATAQKMNWKAKMADAYGEMGMNYSLISNHDSAVFYLQKCLQLGEELNDPKQIALASGTLGNVFYFQSKFPQAIEYFLKSVSAAEKNKDTNATAACLSNIGSIYLDLNDLDKALPYFEKALKLNETTKMKTYEAVNLSNIGIVNSKKGETKIALNYFLRGLAVNQEIHELPGIAALMNSIGSVYYELGLTDSAYYFATQGLQLTTQIQAFRDVGFSYYTLANILFGVTEKNNSGFINKHFGGNKNACLKQAKIYADSSVHIYVSINYIESLSDAYLLLSKIYDKLGNCPSALENYKKYVTAHDSVFNMDNSKKLTQKTMQFEFDKKEAATRAEQENKDIHQRNIRYSISTGLFGALIFLGVVYRQRNKINKEKQRSEELLLNILPAEVAEELKAKGSAEAQLIDEVTVLFTDFKGFTQLSEKLSPKELVAEINECFSAFDHIMHKHGVEKIKTIGDAYMAAGGLPTANKTHPQDVVKASIEIQMFMQEHKAKREAEGKLFFEIRIGIHTGPVVAGIVGVKKFAYDIWGDTVNTASRMESSGEAGKINISETTYALVKDKFTCTYRGKITAKGKGEMEMYFVDIDKSNKR